MNPTTNPRLTSWIPVPADSHFPIQNLPYGVFRRQTGGPAAVGVAIGDQVLDLSVLAARDLLPGGYFDRPSLNAFFAAGRAVQSGTRAVISRLLSADEARLRDDSALRGQALVAQRDVEMLLPCEIGDYTDFYASREHATNVGTMMRGADNALQPNWLHLPVGYHGRASSVVVSGTDLRRPCGQTKPADAPAPLFGPSKNVDFELELGAFIGTGNDLGTAIPADRTPDHLFGVVLLNDWSARDIQAWEYVPLGPFLAKNFGTSISPWVVPLEALEPFRVAGPKQDPEPLPYLKTKGPEGYDIQLEVSIQGAKMDRPHVVCRSNARYLYWSFAQQLAHHTVNGCNLRPGDLLGTGTISGPVPESFGSMLELAWRGTKPIAFPNGETRSFLQDGDRVTMTGWCQGDGYRVGLGEVTGVILPARSV
ncbi:MAG: fumarylacetoacetase [Gemmataceae bacterium]|nr:fumarylacetoacetase [Gemmataceae bacterium]